MATTLHEDVASFLDSAVSTLTNLHVKAAQYAGQPDVQAAFGDPASVPGALIEQAQQLRARLEAEGDGRSRAMKLAEHDLRDDEPKAKKPAAPKR